MTGTSINPAHSAASFRLCPDMISYPSPYGFFLTRIGTNTPSFSILHRSSNSSWFLSTLNGCPSKLCSSSQLFQFHQYNTCTRLVILWWTHFLLPCHFLSSPLPWDKRKGHSSSRSSENKRPFGFSLCYWIKNVNSIRMCFLIPDAILLTLRCRS